MAGRFRTPRSIAPSLCNFPLPALKVTADQTVQLRLEVLRALIDQEIMMQRAEKEGLLASDSDVEAKFNEYKAPYTKEELEKQFEQRKMTEADFKADFRRQLTVDKLFAKEIGSHISISDNDVAAFITPIRPTTICRKTKSAWRRS